MTDRTDMTDMTDRTDMIDRTDRLEAGQTWQDRLSAHRLRTDLVIAITAELPDKLSSRNALTCSTQLSNFLLSVNVYSRVNSSFSNMLLDISRFPV